MKRTLIAAAVLAIATSSAFAHDRDKDSFIFNYTAVGERVGIEGWVALFGCVNVSSTAGAVIQNNQSVWANVDLDPLSGSYTKGSVTTTFDVSHSSVSGSGSKSSTEWSNSFYASKEASGYSKSSSYSYSEKSKEASGGGYNYSEQNASIGGWFSKEKESSGAHISAGGKAGGVVTTFSDNDPGHTVNGFHAQGGFSAGYKASSYENESGIHGKFNAAEGSGERNSWSYENESGSGSQSYSEKSSGYEVESMKSRESEGKSWSFSKNIDESSVSVSGSVTTYIDTRDPTTLTATTGDNAGSGISGNLGLNITEGVDNAQSNDVSLAAVDVGDVFGNAQIFSNQSTGGKAHVDKYVFNASIGDNSLGQVSGNVGVNVASGVGNAQNNSLAASTSMVSPGSASAVAMVATDDNDQKAGMDFSGSMGGTARLGASSLQGAQGNIGINIAGGAGNVQHNGLAIASTSMSH
ncbi:hypothetical protein FAZ69_23185 [Trinickia terrae]|uniref:Cell wall anchor protein n=1 Tax=Trinickia terrae TaxID=2571161 RepID=A0A4U1HUZ5_9BURK|nr:hypothetical protein [Trinickia terrae]TKC83927.1 hypothetical protein FAZ69_23185 [Trinickia terrae]